MAKPRSETFAKNEVGIYHNRSKIVRGRHLLGIDAFTGKNYDYRKDSVRTEFRRIAKEMAIQVLDYAVLASHLDVILRNRPDIVTQWSNAEVVRRWARLCPRRRKPNGKPALPSKAELARLNGMVDELRERLSNISWMMRLALQRVAQRANIEDGAEGRFFAKRFDCERLEDQAAVLNCCLYVDLNWVHAGVAKLPDESTYTSAFERIRAKWGENAEEMSGVNVEEGDHFDGDWLAPIRIDARAQTRVTSSSVPPERTLHEADTKPAPEPKRFADGEARETTFYNALGAACVSNRGFLPIKLEQYLSLLREVSQQLSEPTGMAPDLKSLSTTLKRLQLDPQRWFDSVMSRFEDAHPMTLKRV